MVFESPSLLLSFSTVENQECPADQQRAHSGPKRHIEPLPLLYRHMRHLLFSLMDSLSSVAETAIHHPCNSCGDQQDRHEFDCVHSTSLFLLQPIFFVAPEAGAPLLPESPLKNGLDGNPTKGETMTTAVQGARESNQRSFAK
jgi:hypothetical protein